MVLKIMGVEQLVRNVKHNNVTQSRPGPVGSIGEVVLKPRFRQSTPSMTWAYDPYWAGKRADQLGTNLQDGDKATFLKGWGPARTNDSNWNGDRDFKTQYGWVYHDVQSPDKRTEPVLSALGDYSWRRKLATARIAKRTGKLFSVLPQGYGPAPGQVLRGGRYPVVTDTAGGDGSLGEQVGSGIPAQEPAIPKGYGTNISSLRAGFSRLGMQEQGADVDGIRRRMSGLGL